MFKFGVLVWFLVLSEIECRCIDSYITICDSLEDVRREPVYKKKLWFQLLVQGDDVDGSFNQKHLQNLDFLGKLIINKELKSVESILLPSNLKYLILNANNLPFLKHKSFRLRHRIQVLSLQNNNIAKVQKNFILFRKNSQIGTLSLSYNQLEVLPAALFSKISHVSEFDVRYNKLNKIDTYGLPNGLKILRLDYNNITKLSFLEGSQLTQLEYLSVSHNNLKSLAGLADLNKLKYLDVSYNQIKILETSLEDFRNVRTWNFHGNALKKFQLPAFLKETHFSYEFRLGNNYLRNLKLAPPYTAKITLFLRGNPWNCRCIEEMEEVMRRNSAVLKMDNCDWHSRHSGMYPYCMVNNNTSEVCSGDEISDEKLRQFKEKVKEEDDCDEMYLPTTFVRN